VEEDVQRARAQKLHGSERRLGIQYKQAPLEPVVSHQSTAYLLRSKVGLSLGRICGGGQGREAKTRQV
jgi:hypothetical protein